MIADTSTRDHHRNDRHRHKAHMPLNLAIRLASAAVTIRPASSLDNTIDHIHQIESLSVVGYSV